MKQYKRIRCEEKITRHPQCKPFWLCQKAHTSSTKISAVNTSVLFYAKHQQHDSLSLSLYNYLQTGLTVITLLPYRTYERTDTKRYAAVETRKGRLHAILFIIQCCLRQHKKFPECQPMHC